MENGTSRQHDKEQEHGTWCPSCFGNGRHQTFGTSRRFEVVCNDCNGTGRVYADNEVEQKKN